jgi:hypothetical protein
MSSGDDDQPVLDALLWSNRTLYAARVDPGGLVVVAEPHGEERDRLAEQVLRLNDDLGLRRREVTRARAGAQESGRRLRRLEAITLAGFTASSLDVALGRMLGLARDALGGERAGGPAHRGRRPPRAARPRRAGHGHRRRRHARRRRRVRDDRGGRAADDLRRHRRRRGAGGRAPALPGSLARSCASATWPRRCSGRWRSAAATSRAPTRSTRSGCPRGGTSARARARRAARRRAGH